jgi:hypothetical protein
MRNGYENIPSNQIEKQKKHFYGAIINCLYLRESNSPYVNVTIQNLINEINGLNELFNYQAEILSIIGNLRTAQRDPEQFRSCILNAANLVDTLKGGASDV